LMDRAIEVRRAVSPSPRPLTLVVPQRQSRVDAGGPPSRYECR
jgi:hypothetical protein